LAKVAAHRGIERARDLGIDLYTNFCYCEPEKYFDRDAAAFIELNDTTSKSSQESSQPSSDGNETDDYRKQISIWNVKFFLDLTTLDPTKNASWVGGRDKEKKPGSVQFLMLDKNLRRQHVRFQLSADSGGITITAYSVRARNLYVNGIAVGEDGFTVCGGSAQVLIEGLQFELKYTPISYTAAWTSRRNEFLAIANDGKVSGTLDMTPSASAFSWVCGSWTIREEIGRGGEGSVFIATNDRDVVAAFKKVDRTPLNAALERQKTKMLRDFALKVDEAMEGGVRQQVLKLLEVIPPEEQQLDAATLLLRKKETVNYVYHPLCRETLREHVSVTINPSTLQKRRVLFKSLLTALDFIHSLGYVHRDIKPGNIGVKDGYAVLLDTDQMVVQQGKSDIKARPGGSGTIPYLAPEREMKDYGSLVDMWSAGIVLFQMIYNYRPWDLTQNPFRNDKPNPDLRFRFEEKYNSVMNRLESGDEPLNPLLIRLLSHEYSPQNPGPRPTAKEALEDPVWNLVEAWDESKHSDSEERPAKIARYEKGSTTVELSSERVD
jgi:serine/threonine protein kinase